MSKYKIKINKINTHNSMNGYTRDFAINLMCGEIGKILPIDTMIIDGNGCVIGITITYQENPLHITPKNFDFDIIKGG